MLHYETIARGMLGLAEGEATPKDLKEMLDITSEYYYTVSGCKLASRQVIASVLAIWKVKMETKSP